MSTEFEETGSKRTQVYRELGQGITIFHPQETDPKYEEKLRHAEVDIVAIPGLGANPKECWTHEDTKFNWLRDSEGLASLYPRARIMLYDYASAWRGRFKVRATLKSICTWLLDDLKDKRKDVVEITRPLIFIGHSMGGIVIAKAMSMARAKKDYEAILTCTMGCVFFGAPFKGSDMAKIALLYSNIFGNEAYQSLLSFMKTEKNDVLDEVTEDFMEISHKLAPPISLVCVWEQVPTDVSPYADRFTSSLPPLLQHKSFKAGARKLLEVGFSALGTSTHFVEKDSAVLSTSKSIAMAAGHSDLVKFESIRSSRFTPVKTALDEMIRNAKTSVRKRTSALGQRIFTQRFVNQVRTSLEGIDMRQRFRTKVKRQQVTSWLTSEPAYQDWKTAEAGIEVHHPYLWLKGGPGLGKTNACMAVIEQLSLARNEEQQDVSAEALNETFLVYFLCDTSSGCCTAEDLLKNLIIQMINQEESLAQHAKWFAPTPRYGGPSSERREQMDHEIHDSGAKATPTVDNLFKCLEDMMSDPVVGSVHVVISNIHCLEVNESTTALLAKLRYLAFSLKSLSPDSRRVKWLIASRNDRHIGDYLTANCITFIDMENDHEHGGKIRAARQQYAKNAVLQLRTSKNYSSVLAYYIRNSIESRSEDEKWIDVLCKLLAAMPDNSSDLIVRKRLREIGRYNIPQMVENSWRAILEQNSESILELEELLQVLTTCYEPLTPADLAVLTQIDDLDRLTDLITKCSPLIQRGEWDGHPDRIFFTSAQFKESLTKLCYGESGSQRQFHGLMALRCFKHIKSFYDAAFRRRASTVLAPLVDQRSTTTAEISEDDKVMEVSNEDEETGGIQGTVTNAPLTCSYPVKYLFRHVSEAPPDAVHELYDDDSDFWGFRSELRSGWLEDFQRLTPDFKDINVGGMSAVHVASGIGANELVSVLLGRIGEEALLWTNDDGMTLLHVAAHNNHTHVVDTLIRHRADIEAGNGGAGTPLHYAALRGHCNVMAKLIDQQANVNAISKEYGPVLNAAILSGTVDAVKQIMTGEIRFDFDYTKYQAPISLAAGISEPSLFRDILETGRDKWLRNVKLLDHALVKAAYGGRLESLRILLHFQHVYTNNTIEDAILLAAQEKNWALVDELLSYAIKDNGSENRREIRLDTPFYLATISREERVAILAKMWAFTNCNIVQDILDFSLYEATVLKKNQTALWLLDTCAANANATAEQPRSIEAIAEHTNTRSSIDFGNPLNAAASTGNIDLVRALHRKGAEVDGVRGYSLQLAAGEGHADVVEFLLSHGANVNKEAANDQELSFSSVTALQAACDNSREAVVEILLKHGADPNLGGGLHTNPITAATQGSEPAILKLLLSVEGIDVNVTGGEDKSTPLINAASNMSTECVELLVERDADVNAKNASGDTALIMAAYKGNESCVRLLCRQGADVTHQSPRYGLAIQAASQGSSPLSAKVLAENMGGAIESFREKVRSDHEQSKRDLSQAKMEIEERDQSIEALKNDLEEAYDRLETARKEKEEHELEKESFLSERTLQGTTYQSVGEQIKAIKFERDELQKQLDAEKGQNKMTQAAAADLRKRLDEERLKTAQLRTRQGFTALEEKKAAVLGLEEEKKAWLQKSRQMEEEHSMMLGKIGELQSALQIMEKETTSARTGTVHAMTELESERARYLQLQDELAHLKVDYRELQETLESVQAAASGSRAKSPGSDTQDARNPFSRTGSTMGLDQSVEAAQNPGNHPLAMFNSPGDLTPVEPVESPPMPPTNGSTAQPQPQNSRDTTSPSSPPPSAGFRTVHGQHRPDGSLGGYTNGGGTRRRTSEAPFSPDHAYERTSSSTGSIHSEGSSSGVNNAHGWETVESPRMPERPAPTPVEGMQPWGPALPAKRYRVLPPRPVRRSGAVVVPPVRRE